MKQTLRPLNMEMMAMAMHLRLCLDSMPIPPLPLYRYDAKQYLLASSKLRQGKRGARDDA